MTPPIELLAPAGDRACLLAALEAGADAVYLGLTALNARRNARNFSEAELAEACELVHGQGKRLHLTLNIDLAQDELTRAARILEVASRLHVDAVLVRDPALLALKPHFPELEYHLSTQACVASTADVEAARELGAKRVVLARELSLDEIAAASRVPGIETEVFAHGALCFAVSGRCLLSSWVGGRSGNRGQCTSPCRVAWTLDGAPGGTPFSMHDLSLVARVDELRRARVRSLKIEGRMKNPSWVRAAVALFRKALSAEPPPPDELAKEAERRGATPGRKQTSAYLDGHLDQLIEVAEREKPEPAQAARRSVDATLREGVVQLLREADSLTAAATPVNPDRVRLEAAALDRFLEATQPPERTTIVLEGLQPGALRRVLDEHRGLRPIVALPTVTFEPDLPRVQALIEEAGALGLSVEANTWGAWLFAKRAGVQVLGGPGLGLLNALAAKHLNELGFAEGTASVETDASKLEALLARTPLPCTVVAFGRPALLTTRAELPDPVTGAELEDRRAAKLRARRVGSVWELRPVLPFDLRALRLPDSAHVEVDLVASPDPAGEWSHRPEQSTRFNYDRALS